MLHRLITNLCKSSKVVNAQMRLNCSVSSLLSQTIDKSVASKILLKAKHQSKLTFKDLAEKLNVNKVWLASAILGKHPMQWQVAKQLINLLQISGTPQEVDSLLQALISVPENRGTFRDSNDPVLRRFQELMLVYGDSIKGLIREEAGDGIMSAIDCTITFDTRKGDNEEVRIVITIDGKYLPYKTKH